MNLFENMTSKKVEKKGQILIKIGRIFMVIGLCALALFLLILLIAATTGSNGIENALTLNFHSKYAFGLPFMILAYLGIFVGICGLPTYMYGLNLFTLARIAVNTEKDKPE